ncbi:MAG: c-type cytochrome [Steroidobacteraceae bacterium]
MKPGPGPWLLLAACASFACGVAGAASGPELFETCVACHGRRAEGNVALGAPALAGQQADYLRRQLQNFRAGLRGAEPGDVPGSQMRAAVTVLRDDASVAAVAAYLASLPKTTVVPARGADLRNGNNLYHGKCGACHGGKAEGNVALSSPRLAGLDAAYIERQHGNFRSGVRGGRKEDRYGRQMGVMAHVLATGKDLDDVIAYIHAQGAAK